MTDVSIYVEACRDGVWYPVAARRHVLPDDLEWFWGHDHGMNAILLGLDNGPPLNADEQAGDDLYADPVTPIDEPRGAPRDLSTELREYVSLADHVTWFTLHELASVRWHDQVIRQRGWVSARQLDQYDRFRVNPETWHIAVAGPGVALVSTQHLRRLLKYSGALTDPVFDSYFAPLEWDESWAYIAAGDIFPIMNEMLIAATQLPADQPVTNNVRCVISARE